MREYFDYRGVSYALDHCFLNGPDAVGVGWSVSGGTFVISR